MFIPSRKAAEQLGVHPNTLRRWADEGKIEYIRTPTNQRRYDIASLQFNAQSREKICYCRVSSAKQKDDLERQISYMRTRYPNHRIIEDIGSGLNFKRKGFASLLEQIMSGSVAEVVVAHKDRLCRFGFEIVQKISTENACQLLVLDSTELSPQEELVQDLVSIIHVFSCRIHGLRSYSRKIKKDPTVSGKNRKRKIT